MRKSNERDHWSLLLLWRDVSEVWSEAMHALGAQAFRLWGEGETVGRACRPVKLPGSWCSKHLLVIGLPWLPRIRADPSSSAALRERPLDMLGGQCHRKFPLQ
jgi:hypothetical protein